MRTAPSKTTLYFLLREGPCHPRCIAARSFPPCAGQIQCAMPFPSRCCLPCPTECLGTSDRLVPRTDLLGLLLIGHSALHCENIQSGCTVFLNIRTTVLNTRNKKQDGFYLQLAAHLPARRRRDHTKRAGTTHITPFPLPAQFRHIALASSVVSLQEHLPPRRKRRGSLSLRTDYHFSCTFVYRSFLSMSFCVEYFPRQLLPPPRQRRRLTQLFPLSFIIPFHHFLSPTATTT